MLWLIAGGALVLLGGLAYLINKMPNPPRIKKKKEPPPEPPRDWQGIAERFERRAHGLESRLQDSERILREKDKEISAKEARIVDLEQRYEQEQTWRKKEEVEVEKERKREKSLEADLHKISGQFDEEMTKRIKLDYEVRELRTVKESLTADARKLSLQNTELDRKIILLADENRSLRSQNAALKVKKEADQWVAKDDYNKVEKLLKRARWEVDQFKRKFPKELWPQAILPKPAPNPEPPPVVAPKVEVQPDTAKEPKKVHLPDLEEKTPRPSSVEPQAPEKLPPLPAFPEGVGLVAAQTGEDILPSDAEQEIVLQPLLSDHPRPGVGGGHFNKE